MRILQLGKNGQVGRELQRSLAPLGELVALDPQKVDRLFGDLSDLLRPSKELETLSVIADQTGLRQVRIRSPMSPHWLFSKIQTRKELPGIRYVLAKLAIGHRPESLGSL